jgi:hypothetical protein
VPKQWLERELAVLKASPVQLVVVAAACTVDRRVVQGDRVE